MTDLCLDSLLSDECFQNSCISLLRISIISYFCFQRKRKKNQVVTQHLLELQGKTILVAMKRKEKWWWMSLKRKSLIWWPIFSSHIQTVSSEDNSCRSSRKKMYNLIQNIVCCLFFWLIKLISGNHPMILAIKWQLAISSSLDPIPPPQPY